MAVSELTEAMIQSEDFPEAGIEFVRRFLTGRSANKKRILVALFCEDPSCQHPLFGSRLALALFLWMRLRHDLKAPYRQVRIAAGEARRETGSLPLFMVSLGPSLEAYLEADFSTKALSRLDEEFTGQYMPYVESLILVTIIDPATLEALAWETIYPLDKTPRRRVHQHVEEGVFQGLSNSPWNDTTPREESVPLITEGEARFRRSLFERADPLGDDDRKTKAFSQIALHTLEVINLIEKSH